ncbi:MAG: Mth938-like domain-containing protein [Candidatus Competibacterales bacterium]|nr:Mth938-like domain-containing protein [Candidatus Competibacterales bacterium]
MKLSLDHNDQDYIIHGYQDGAVRVNQQRIDHSVLVGAGQIESWPPTDFEALAPEHFEAIADLEPELVLLGTGARQRFPHPRLTRALVERGIGVESMDTGAACRTFNIVAAEGRRVIAALLMI